MTALLDFPITTAPDAGDPLVIASAVRLFDLDEFAVALHLSGAKLTRAMTRDMDTLVSLVEIGAASVGLEQLRDRVRRMAAARSAMVLEMQQGLPADETGREYLRLVGGYRRSTLCIDSAYHLLEHFGRNPLAVIPYACDPS